jgi:adenylate cyclase
MGHLEIERKFFVAPGDQRWRTAVQRRVRVRADGQQGWLNVKAMTPGLARAEFEYPLPIVDAAQLLDTLCGRPLIEKTRHFVQLGAHLWEIDEFEGDNAGLVVAEVELQHADEAVELPVWAAMEVTENIQFYNFRLAEHPWSLWGSDWLKSEYRRREP